MSEPVMADAQFGIAKVLRPRADYQTLYQGLASTWAIYMAEPNETGWSPPYDDSAGKPGYSRWLQRGVKVPIGSRLIIWFPFLKRTAGGISNELIEYRWTISWRLRSLYDYRQSRSPYHLPKQHNGTTVTDAIDPGPRVVCPVAAHSVTYGQVEPAGPPPNLSGRAAQHIVTEDYRPNGTWGDTLDFNTPRPVALQSDPLWIPGQPVPASMGQGITPHIGEGPQWIVHEVQAFGDELLIGIYRDNVARDAPWDFVGGFGYSDNELATRFAGSVDFGVYIIPGSAP